MFVPTRACLSVALFAVACSAPSGKSAKAEPAGTPADPVEICRESGQVCRFDGPQLGVCVIKSGAGSSAVLTCASQH